MRKLLKCLVFIEIFTCSRVFYFLLFIHFTPLPASSLYLTTQHEIPESFHSYTNLGFQTLQYFQKYKNLLPRFS